MKKIGKIILSGIIGLSSFAMISMLSKAAKVDALEIPEGQTLDTHVDNISIKDLTLTEKDGRYSNAINQTRVPANRDT